MNNQEILNINNINKLSKEELIKIKENINSYFEPYRKELNEVYKRLAEINTEEYLKKRAIKNYPILQKLLNKLGEKYKDVIIDLDEFLGIKRYDSIRIYGKLNLVCENRNIKFTNELYKLVKTFMIENFIVIPKYEILCPKCHDKLLTFTTNPKSNTFIKDLKNEIKKFYSIENSEICCYNCGEEIDLNDADNIQQSDFYKIIRK